MRQTMGKERKRLKEAIERKQILTEFEKKKLC